MLTGNIVDIFNETIQFGNLTVIDNRISEIQILGEEKTDFPYILPGFIDSHVHIESSMLVPSEFARLAVLHGTVATISDPHEIANVCGLAGVEYMINNGKTVPFKFHFGAPSCVPATRFETSGAEIDADGVKILLGNPDIFYLSEMMNFPGVLNADEEVMQKIAAAKLVNKPVDGHAPGLMGDDAANYIATGISTDHECFTAAEALNKLQHGMKILIREGSAAKNFDALIHLLHDHQDTMMFCSDDKHPDSLAASHINALCARAIAKGLPLFKVLKAACINPVLHYNMKVGLLRVGDPADFIVVNNLTQFDVLQTYIDGTLIADKGQSLINADTAVIINQFDCTEKNNSAFVYPYQGEKEIPVIEALDGQLITNKLSAIPKVVNDKIVSDPSNDLIKIVVVNRYHDAPVAISFIKNTGILKGAIASSVAHDSHNIVGIGVDDESLCKAINLIIGCKGGISAVNDSEEILLPLPVAGLMSNKNAFEVAEAYTSIDQFVKENLGSTLSAPFMTLSFMALLVIPHLKLSDKGLFDGDRFSFVD
jgi:adenine deaminase